MKACFLFTFFLPLMLFAQPPVSITTWKNGASGCYNIIHDDFGSNLVIGINNYADTMTFNRGIKITFGAITEECESKPEMYVKAKSMINDHGHEIINHSHTHTCAVSQSWCTTKFWAEPATEDFAMEIDLSSELIRTKTDVDPKFFIYPYDQFNETANNYLKSKGYIGSRTGAYNSNSSANFLPDADGFFKTAFVVDVVENKAINLNERVQEAINQKRWINRELHNVGDDGWGHVTVDEYRDHLNFVKTKMDAGELWVGTISEILTYRIQRIKYTPSSIYNAGTETITVNWNNNNTFNIESYLQPLKFKSPITLSVDITNYPGNYHITQNGNEITDYHIKNNSILINVYPHNGPVVLTKTALSANEEKFLNELYFYPMPASGELKCNKSFEHFSIQVLDITGRNTDLNLTEAEFIDISSLPEGIYFINLKGKSGISKVYKFIKQ